MKKILILFIVALQIIVAIAITSTSEVYAGYTTIYEQDLYGDQPDAYGDLLYDWYKFDFAKGCNTIDEHNCYYSDYGYIEGELTGDPGGENHDQIDLYPFRMPEFGYLTFDGYDTEISDFEVSIFTGEKDDYTFEEISFEPGQQIELAPGLYLLKVTGNPTNIQNYALGVSVTYKHNSEYLAHDIIDDKMDGVSLAVYNSNFDHLYNHCYTEQLCEWAYDDFEEVLSEVYIYDPEVLLSLQLFLNVFSDSALQEVYNLLEAGEQVKFYAVPIANGIEFVAKKVTGTGTLVFVKNMIVPDSDLSSMVSSDIDDYFAGVLRGKLRSKLINIDGEVDKGALSDLFERADIQQFFAYLLDYNNSDSFLEFIGSFRTATNVAIDAFERDDILLISITANCTTHTLYTDKINMCSVSPTDFYPNDGLAGEGLKFINGHDGLNSDGLGHHFTGEWDFWDLLDSNERKYLEYDKLHYGNVTKFKIDDDDVDFYEFTPSGVKQASDEQPNVSGARLFIKEAGTGSFSDEYLLYGISVYNGRYFNVEVDDSQVDYNTPNEDGYDVRYFVRDENNPEIILYETYLKVIIIGTEYEYKKQMAVPQWVEIPEALQNPEELSGYDGSPYSIQNTNLYYDQIWGTTETSNATLMKKYASQEVVQEHYSKRTYEYYDKVCFDIYKKGVDSGPAMVGPDGTLIYLSDSFETSECYYIDRSLSTSSNANNYDYKSYHTSSSSTNFSSIYIGNTWPVYINGSNKTVYMDPRENVSINRYYVNDVTVTRDSIKKLKSTTIVGWSTSESNYRYSDYYYDYFTTSASYVSHSGEVVYDNVRLLTEYTIHSKATNYVDVPVGDSNYENNVYGYTTPYESNSNYQWILTGNERMNLDGIPSYYQPNELKNLDQHYYIDLSLLE